MWGEWSSLSGDIKYVMDIFLISVVGMSEPLKMTECYALIVSIFNSISKLNDFFYIEYISQSPFHSLRPVFVLCVRLSQRKNNGWRPTPN